MRLFFRCAALVWVACMVHQLATAQRSFPFQLPAVWVPGWAKSYDWNHPNVFHTDSLVQAERNSEANRPNKPGQREAEEDPFATAYIRWRNGIAPFIQADGSIKVDNTYHRRMQEASLATKPVGRNKTTAAANWHLLGPVESFRDNNQGPADEQSNIYCITVAPSNHSILYASSEPGTVYRSTDKGRHWTSISDSLYSASTGSIAVDPTDDRIVYFVDFSSGTLLKTMDAGAHWRIMSAYTGRGGNRILVAPVSHRLLVTGDTAIYYSNDTGATWSRATGTGMMYDMMLNPTSRDTVYASGQDAAHKLVLIRSVDGGINFSNVTGAVRGINTGGSRLAVTRAATNYVYCINIGDTSAPRMIRSTDRGNSWAITAASHDSTSLTGNGDTTGLGMSNGQGYYDLDLTVSQLDPRQVIVGTTSIYRSVDGGFNFKPIGGYTGNLPIHPDLQSAISIDSETYLATDGGVVISTDFYASARNLSVRNNGLRSADYWGFGQGWDEDITVGGRYHNGNAAVFENYGPGNAVTLGGGEDATGHVFHGHSRITGFRDIGTVGIPATLADPINYATPFTNTLWPQDDYYGLFASKLMTDPRYTNIFYVGKDTTLWKSTNAGASYTALHNFGTGNKVWRFDIARSNPDYIYVCTNNGIYKTTDGGISWARLTLPATYQYYNTDIVVDPMNEQNVYYCMSFGDSTSKVFQSTNAGTSWTNLTGNALKYKHVAFLQYHGGSNGGLYAITNDRPTQVFYRDNTMSDWVDYSQGLPASHAAREGGIIFYRDNKLRMAGNCSIWESNLYTNAAPVAQPACNKPRISCSRDTVRFYDYSMCVAAGMTRLWSFPGASWVSSTTAANPLVLYPGPGNYNVTLKVTNASGLTHTRTVNNMVVFGPETCNPDTVAGRALQMNGDYQVVNLGNVNINSNNFSISCWVRPHGLQSSFSEIISHAAYPGSGGYGFALGFTFMGYTPNLQLCYTDSIVNYSNYSGLDCDSTQWNFVTLTYSPSAVTIYLNGRPAVVNSGPMPVIDLSQSPFYVNYDCHRQGSRLDADVDEVKFYNYALTQNEVREKMHLIQRNPTTETGLLKYFQFNQYDVLDGTLYDVASGYSTYVPTANMVTSTAPVATGTVYRNPSVTAAGLNNFPAADVALHLPATGTYPAGEMVAFHLNGTPDTRPGTRPMVTSYFVVNNYGSDTVFSMPDSVVLSALRIRSRPYRPGVFKLYKRPGGAFGNTWGNEVDSADAWYYNAAGSKLTFSRGNNLTSLFSQLAIVNTDTTGLAGIGNTGNAPGFQLSDVYPNPSGEWAHVDINLPGVTSTALELTITDVTGRQYSRFAQEVHPGPNTLLFPVAHLPEGNYLLSVLLPGEGNLVRRMVVRR